MTPADLMARALAAKRDSADRILYGVAAFDALVSDDVVLVGGGAQVTHTGLGRLTDIDLVGRVSKRDETSLIAFGFQREGRHWVFENDEGALAVELPASSLAPEESFELIELEGCSVRVISVTDLMMDRLVLATDGTDATRQEASELARAAGDRIDWDALAGRAERVAVTTSSLGSLPELVAEARP